MPSTKPRIHKVCARCGRTFRTHDTERTLCVYCKREPNTVRTPLSEDALHASRAGMTYGKWRAAQWLKEHQIIGGKKG